tara:strand:- start:6098 stop:6397 length:300 start_codon:yes stop_codon:yes gene_type:complete
MNKKENPWKTLKKNTVYGTVAFQNIAVGIIPIDKDNCTYLVGQFRFPLNAYSWEIPEGGCVLNTDPLTTAKRELKEETGIVAKNWDELQTIHTSNSVTD